MQRNLCLLLIALLLIGHCSWAGNEDQPEGLGAYRLAGVMTDGAIIEEISTGRQFILAVGDSLAGYTLLSLAVDSVRVADASGLESVWKLRNADPGPSAGFVLSGVVRFGESGVPADTVVHAGYREKGYAGSGRTDEDGRFSIQCNHPVEFLNVYLSGKRYSMEGRWSEASEIYFDLAHGFDVAVAGELIMSGTKLSCGYSLFTYSEESEACEVAYPDRDGCFYLSSKQPISKCTIRLNDYDSGYSDFDDQVIEIEMACVWKGKEAHSLVVEPPQGLFFLYGKARNNKGGLAAGDEGMYGAVIRSALADDVVFYSRPNDEGSYFLFSMRPVETLELTYLLDEGFEFGDCKLPGPWTGTSRVDLYADLAALIEINGDLSKTGLDLEDAAVSGLFSSKDTKDCQVSHDGRFRIVRNEAVEQVLVSDCDTYLSISGPWTQSATLDVAAFLPELKTYSMILEGSTAMTEVFFRAENTVDEWIRVRRRMGKYTVNANFEIKTVVIRHADVYVELESAVSVFEVAALNLNELANYEVVGRLSLEESQRGCLDEEVGFSRFYIQLWPEHDSPVKEFRCDSSGSFRLKTNLSQIKIDVYDFQAPDDGLVTSRPVATVDVSGNSSTELLIPLTVVTPEGD